MAYHLRLNLQQIAALNIAISFWKKKEVKDKAAEFFLTYNSQWQRIEFTKKILDEWSEDLLPKKLEAELIHIIKMIGERIFNCLQYMKHDYKKKEELINCIDEIKWTSYGTVDIVKIFESSWLRNPYRNISALYKFVCHHALEDHIDSLWNKIPSHIQDGYDDSIYYSNNTHILAYWKHCRDNDLPNFMRNLQDAANEYYEEDEKTFIDIYDFNLSIEENMLRLSVYQGYFNATKYFWEKLTEEKRAESVVKCAHIAVRSYYYEWRYGRIKYYKKSQYVEICIFLINQMSEAHKKALFNGKMRYSDYSNWIEVQDVILRMLLSTWPWEEFFIPVLKNIMQCLDDNSQMDYRFLDVITTTMVKNYELDDLMEFDEYRCLLREVWIIIPASIKQKIVRFDTITSSINNLIKIWDLDSLNLILNDQAIANDRDELIEMRSSTYRYLIKEDEFEKLDQFIEKILRSEEEKKEFKQKFKIFGDLIKEGKFELADKLLDWQSSTPEERQILKNEIDHIKFCADFISEDKYELLNKFSDWKLNTEEEKRKCKDHFKNCEFSITTVYRVWKRCNSDINSAKNKCFQFLHWLFESEEEITLFKKEIVFNFESYTSKMDYFDRFQCRDISISFVSWCLLDNENFQLAQRMIQAVVQLNISPFRMY